MKCLLYLWLCLVVFGRAVYSLPARTRTACAAGVAAILFASFAGPFITILMLVGAMIILVAGSSELKEEVRREFEKRNRP